MKCLLHSFLFLFGLFVLFPAVGQINPIVSELRPISVNRNDSVTMTIVVRNTTFTSNHVLITLKNNIDSNFLSITNITVVNDSTVEATLKVSKSAPGRNYLIQISNTDDSSVVDAYITVNRWSFRLANNTPLTYDSVFQVDILGKNTFFTANTVQLHFYNPQVSADSFTLISDTLCRIWVRTSLHAKNYCGFNLIENESDSTYSLIFSIQSPSVRPVTPKTIGLGDTTYLTLSGFLTRFKRVDSVYFETANGNKAFPSIQYTIVSDTLIELTIIADTSVLSPAGSYNLKIRDSLWGPMNVSNALKLSLPVASYISRNKISKSASDTFCLAIKYLSPYLFNRITGIDLVQANGTIYPHLRDSLWDVSWSNQTCSLIMGLQMSKMIQSGTFILRLNFPEGAHTITSGIQIMKPQYIGHSPQLFSTQVPTEHSFIFDHLYETGISFKITSIPAKFTLDSVFVVGDTVKIIGQAHRLGAFSFDINSDIEGIIASNIFYGSDDVALPEVEDIKASVYPVPAGNRVFIGLSTENPITEVYLTDMRGKQYAPEWSIINHQLDIDLTSFDSGLYFIHLHTQTGNQTVKIVHHRE